MKHKRNSLVPGILLIAFGCYFLLRRFIVTFPIWEQLYPILILVLAGLLLWDTYRNNRPGTLFWAVFFLCIGAFFLLRNYDIIPYLYVEEYWPVFLLAFGLSFIVKFIVNPRDWGALVPGTFLLFFGLKHLLDNFEEFYWEHSYYIDDLWPLIIIVIGIGMLISGIYTSKIKNSESSDPSSSSPTVSKDE
ncbi:hypothetical protein JW835_06805 [bacterium]|nr:hypothetical protein [bacterium]